MSDNQTKLEIWKEYLLNQKNSGLSVRTWCSENQISQPQFYYWKRKLSQETSAQPQFAEICLKSLRARPPGTKLKEKGFKIFVDGSKYKLMGIVDGKKYVKEGKFDYDSSAIIVLSSYVLN